jgi:hypothetical protein
MTDIEYYNKYLKGCRFKVSYDKSDILYMLGDFIEYFYDNTYNSYIEITWVTDNVTTKADPEYSIKDVLEYINEKDWIILKTDLRKKKIEMLKNG